MKCGHMMVYHGKNKLMQRAVLNGQQLAAVTKIEIMTFYRLNEIYHLFRGLYIDDYILISLIGFIYFNGSKLSMKK